MNATTRLLASGWLLVTPACIASSVVDSAGRAVAPRTAEFAWRPALAGDLHGLYESVEIEGEAAVSVWKLYYAFAADGSYSGAALVLGGANPEFQTLSGRWTLVDGILDLGDGQTARVLAAPEHLRLEHEGGTAILRRADVQ